MNVGELACFLHVHRGYWQSSASQQLIFNATAARFLQRNQQAGVWFILTCRIHWDALTKIIKMEVSETYCDLNLDQYDTDLSWLKRVPITFTCEKCTKSFKRRCHLKSHEKKCSGENRCPSLRWNWMAGILEQSSFNESSHHSEVRRKVHSKEKTFVCDVCQRAFKEKHQLVRHQKIHTGEKPFVCEICEKAFARSDHLIVHRRLHIQPKPFVCDICCGRFSRKDKLLKHKLIHQVP